MSTPHAIKTIHKTTQPHAKISNISERRNPLKAAKKDSITILTILCNRLKYLFWAGFCKEEDSQTIYVQLTTASQDSLQILQKRTQSSGGRRHYDFPSIDFGQVLGIWTCRLKYIAIRKTLKTGVEETKTARPCCRGLIIAHLERALGEQQMTEILTIL